MGQGAGGGDRQVGLVGERNDSVGLGEGRQGRSRHRAGGPVSGAPGEAGKGGGDALSPSGQPLA